MSRRRSTPQNVVRLSNVAVVKLQRGGTRFEVACYPHKVTDYRNGVENDIDEVLQVRQVFKKASKGQVASKKEVEKAFAGLGIEAACEEILKLGELQVSEKERTAKAEAVSRDLAQIVAEKTMDTQTGRPVPASAIEKIMHDLNFTVSLSRSAKQQALDLIRRIEHEPSLGLARAKMRLKIVAESMTAREALLKVDGVVPDGPTTFLAEPRAFRAATAAVEAHNTSIEVIDHAARLANPTPTTQSIEKNFTPPVKDTPTPLTTSNDNSTTTNTKKSKAAKRQEKEDAAQRALLLKDAEERRQKHRQELSTSLHDETPEHTAGETSDKHQQPSRLACNTCGGSFPSPAAHRHHFRSDWHRYNLKRKLENKPPISEADFNDLDLLLTSA